MFRDSRGVVHTVSSPDPLEDLPPEGASALAAALLQLFSMDEPIRSAIGRRGRDWVLDHFDAPGVAEQTLRLYGEGAGRDSAPALVPQVDPK